MQLNSILHLTGELLQGSGESPSDESADTDALLPFAAVLSGAFSLVDPIQEASDEGTDAPDSEPPLLASDEGTDAPDSEPPLLWLSGLEEIHLSEIADLDPAASATPPLAEEALTEGVVLDQSTMPDGETSQSTPPEPGVAQGDDAAPQTVAEETSVMPVEEDAPPNQESKIKAEEASVMPVEEDALPNQEKKIKTEVAPLLTEDEAPSEPAEPLRGQRQTEPTKTTVHEKVSTSEQPGELVSQATVQHAEKAVADGTTATEIDVALPDLEGTAQDKTTDSSVELEADAATTRAEGGDLSSDAGDDQEGRREGTPRTPASRQSRRADAEPSVFQKTEGPSSQGSSPQETMSPEAASATETAPEQAEANLASPDLDPGLALAEEHVVQAATEQKASEAPAGRIRSARGGLSQSRVVPAAWLRAVLGNARQSVFADGGWKVLEMNLDEGDGSVTIKAKREDGRVAVAVGFSDPVLRALATAHADRLQEVLQTEYETAVDFSLFSNDADHSNDQQHAEGAGAPLSGVTPTDGEGDVRDERSARRPLPTGTHHEWVG